MDTTLGAGILAAIAALFGSGIGALVTWRITLSYREQATLQRTTALVPARVVAYSLLIKRLQQVSTADKIANNDLRKISDEMETWYYQEGGWLMDGTSFNSYRAAREALAKPGISAETVRKALSMLRTHFKIELGVRQESEGPIQFAGSKERERK